MAAAAAPLVVVAPAEPPPTVPSPMIAFHASAAAWSCVVATAAALACAHDACTSAGALQGLPSRWQMNPAITAILSADPWLKSCWLAAMKAFVSRPSSPASKRMLALEQEPRSSAARFGSVGRMSRVKRFFLRLLAAWQYVFCSSHCWTSAEIAPLLAALAQALCCMSQDRPFKILVRSRFFILNYYISY